MTRDVCRLSWICLLLCGCGCSDAKDAAPDASATPDASTDVADASDTCATEGTGTLVVAVTGLPSGVDAVVQVVAEGGDTTTISGGSVDLASGPYTVVADRVAGVDPVVRPVYVAEVTSVATCVRKGEDVTVTIDYSMVPTSNHVWVDNGQEVLGYASDVLSSSGSPDASIVADTHGGKGVTFDVDGNLWVLGGTTTDPLLARYPASAFVSSGTKTADVSIRAIQGNVCIPAAAFLTFEPSSGDLWVSLCGGEIVQLAADELADTDEIMPVSRITGLDSPEGMAFDADGNLWIADGVVKKISASQLDAASITDVDLAIDAQSPSPVVLSLGASNLAFDSSGNLWVAAFASNVVYRLTPSDLGGTGTSTMTPEIQVSIGVGALLEGIAFDEEGGLWLAHSAGEFARLSPEQLTVSSGPGAPTVPDRIISSGSVSYAGDIALYPAPAGLPLYHSLP